MKNNKVVDLVINRSARFSYSLEKTYEAGIVLEGWEVKSIKSSNANLLNSFVKNVDNELFLIGAHVSRLKNGFRSEKVNEVRDRKLLLNRSQIDRLLVLSKQPGYSVIAVKFYLSGNIIKLEIALAKGLKKYDKRKKLKEIEIKKSISSDRLF